MKMALQSGLAKIYDRCPTEGELMTFAELMKISINEFYFEELSKQCIEREVIPFVGAGLSYPTYPLWRNYIIQLAKDFFIDDIVVCQMLDEYKYEDATDFIYSKIKHRAFSDHIKANFGIKKVQDKEIVGPVTYLPCFLAIQL